MPYIVDPSTEQTRFDLSTLMQEWVDFLETQCGYEKADFALVATLSARHHALFRTILHEELGVGWEEIEGLLIIPDHLWALMQYQGEKISIHQLDLVWHDCFEAVNEEMDEIEEQLHLEREHGLG